MTKKLFYNGDIITLEDELYTEAVLIEDGKERQLYLGTVVPGRQ